MVAPRCRRRCLWLALGSQACFTPNLNAPTETETETGTETRSGTDGTTSSPTETMDSGTAPSTSAAPASESTDTGTKGASDSTSPGSSTGSGAPRCGDGRVDEGEQCDDGAENGGRRCTEVCTEIVCGDGIVSSDEVCDDGDDNSTELGACAPDCSAIVEARVITLSYGYSANGNLGGHMASQGADSRCESAGLPGYKAIFADGIGRRATTTPYAGDGQIDWVLRPWTRYVREDGELVWVTDTSALLGVRDGAPQDLVNPIDATGTTAFAVTGLRATWVANTTDDCNGWTSNGDFLDREDGDPRSISAGAFLDNPAGDTDCVVSTVVYCVEQ